MNGPTADYPSMLLRCWRSVPWSRNPLMRGSDRIEVFARVLAVIVLLIAIPVSGAAGTVSYTAAAAHIRADNATKVAVPATLVADPVTSVTAGTGDRSTAQSKAAVRWVRQGAIEQATVNVSQDAVRGTVIQIWLGPDGRPTDAPIPTESAGFIGLGTGFTLLSAIVAGVVIALGALRWALNRRRGAAWAREWFLIAHPLGRDHR